MKYLILFENYDYDDHVEKHKQEVIEFSKMYLADLIDKGSVNIIIEDTGLQIWKYMVKVLLGVGRDMKTWGSIKDQLIPYLKMFVREYGKISNITVLGRTSIDIETITYDKFIEDDYIDDDYKVRAIKFLF